MLIIAGQLFMEKLLLNVSVAFYKLSDELTILCHECQDFL